MTPESTPPAPDDKLQFDRVSTGKPGQGPAGGAVTCSSCRKPITDVYYHIGGRPICASCREKAVREIAAWQARGRGGGAMMRSLLYGGAAMIAGAFIYWAVMALAHLEIGIVAILIGWMVGYMIRKATHNLGGRRYQVLAVGLTYFAVGLAYAPIAANEVKKVLKERGALQAEHGKRGSAPMIAPTDSAVTSDSTVASDSAVTSDSTPLPGTITTARDSAVARPSAAIRILAIPLGLLALFLLILALPILGIVGSMPGGLISAFIIFIGLRTAWQMTREASIDVRGPFRVGGAAPAASP